MLRHDYHCSVMSASPCLQARQAGGDRLASCHPALPTSRQYAATAINMVRCYCVAPSHLDRYFPKHSHAVQSGANTDSTLVGQARQTMDKAKAAVGMAGTGTEQQQQMTGEQQGVSKAASAPHAGIGTGADPLEVVDEEIAKTPLGGRPVSSQGTGRQ